MAKSIILPPGIGSYVTVLEPRPDQQGKMKFSISVLFPKNRSKELDPLRAMALAVASEKWGTKAADILARAKYPIIKDGDLKVDDEGRVDPVYKGMLVVSARTDRKPGVVDAKRQPVYTDQDVYSGCTVRISGGVFAYDYQGNKGVSLGLNNVQVCFLGPRIDGRKAAEEEFDEYVPPEGGADPLA